MTAQIPSPRTLPFLGNVTQIEKEVPLRSYVLLSRQYGEIYRLMQFSQSTLVVSSYELTNEVSDEKRFIKNPGGALEQVRHGVGDGLFTAKPGEEKWGIAHRLLMPAFGPTALKSMFDDMNDIAMQLITKWERSLVKSLCLSASDFTRLAFDTIAYCSMSHRLNSFYRETNHPFVQAMGDFLVECMGRPFRPPIVTNMMGYNIKYEEDIKVLADLANQIVADRKANPTEKNDLLNRMLNGKGSKTGKGSDDENIKNNSCTDELSSAGTLSFLTYYLLKHPHVIRKLREEVDEVFGDRPPQVDDLGKLPYLTACLRETLRLSPPAPLRNVESVDDTTLCGGKYAVKKGEAVTVLEVVMMRDPKVWGEDADEFKPERMLEENFAKLPPNAWQPFGYGMRGCIGRAFFWQEALLMVSLIAQRFHLVMDDPSYELHIKHAMSIKPADFHIHVMRRKDRSVHYAIPTAVSSQVPHQTRQQAQAAVASGEGKQPMYVLYGSNTGTSEAFAQRVVSGAPAHGFRATMGTLDAFAARLPTDGPIVVITASFEGEPADNAAHFVEWLTNLKGKELANVAFGVFGCGNRDWAQTYQRIPTLIDRLLEEGGARRTVPRGAGDANAADFYEKFDEWEVLLWQTMSKARLEMKTVDEGTTRASVLRQPDVALGTVIENRLLTGPGVPAKRHLEFEPPEGTAYRAGDYLAILPSNPDRDVHRVIARFGLSPEQEANCPLVKRLTPLPVGRPITVQALLAGYVELCQTATTRDLRVLMAVENAPAEALQALSDSYADKVLATRLSVLEILEEHPSLALPFLAYLQLLLAMRIRQYSISSSPLWNPSHVTITVSVLDAPAHSGRTHAFLGVASTFLAGMRAGDKVQIAVKASGVAFHPPADPAVPMVLFAAGSGLAPMRGFLQERAMQKKAGRDVGKSVLFLGCRKPGDDFLYAETDLKEWRELGIVDVRPAFSRAPEESEGCKYVQDRAWHDRCEINDAYKAHTRVSAHPLNSCFTSGNLNVAQGIKDVLLRIIKANHAVDDAEAEAIFGRITQGRYATDVFE
ncbi:cytochrome P450 [Fomitopsis serialis]|uniref:cytochrome P450 n=1 Tax=Fomitopsis serialis TaxID=139415 RepID=UPI002008ADDC|nr:cytochrome P450 [Neoantrodia serialis]KAH9922470.1 cytochrome P450 [Neoantrodia serialis]